MSRPHLLDPGTVIRNTYTVDRLLGSGAFADVYLVRHRFMGMQAMKVFRARALATEAGADALREAFLLARFGHPNIVRVFEANLLAEEHGAREYLTMEFVDGPTLDEYVRARPRLSIRRCLEIACQIAAAVAQAHAQTPPVVHRDIKPHNVLLSETSAGRPQVKLADFGLAMPVGDYTRIASAAGTLFYMSPECLDGFAVPASDVWSMGVVLHELLCGSLPYAHALLEGRVTHGELVEALREAQGEPFRPPSFFRTDVPEELDAIVGAALARDRKQRHRDAVGFFDTLTEYRIRTGGAPKRAQAPSAAGARALVERAYDVARQPASLPGAIELLEQAIALDPRLRKAHEAALDQWRRGIAFLA